MVEKQKVNVFWFRRDLRLNDNAGLYHALKSGLPVIPFFLLDREILDKLADKDDSRVTFIYQALEDLNIELNKLGSYLIVKHNNPVVAWEELLNEYAISAVYLNQDYEPYARERDKNIEIELKKQGVDFYSYKDHVIFEKNEITKEDGKPYTVFTPYKNKWLEKLKYFYFKAYPTEKYFSNFSQTFLSVLPSLLEIGFIKSSLPFPDKEYKYVIEEYKIWRDFPSLNGTSKISVHLRFGTLSIRELVSEATLAADKTWLNELIWRDFYAMIIWHFPHTVTQSFKPLYDQIKWRNNEQEFEAWCEGKTGYPIVDAGMRELNTTGFMHNRVRMITASFLVKHLLIDWRWGEAYFARKLIDYDQASNVGGWQWATGSGNDASPYFRVFSPDLQMKKFDPKLEYIKKWIPEFNDPFQYPQPIVEHKFARERAISAYKLALSE